MDKLSMYLGASLKAKANDYAIKEINKIYKNLSIGIVDVDYHNDVILKDKNNHLVYIFNILAKYKDIYNKKLNELCDKLTTKLTKLTTELANNSNYY